MSLFTWTLMTPIPGVAAPIVMAARNVWPNKASACGTPAGIATFIWIQVV
jgi:hypothetical protein